MKTIKILFFLLLTIAFSFGQNLSIEKYQKAEDLLKANEILSAYKIFKELNSQVSKTDTLYNYVTWYYEATTSHLESENRLKEKYQTSLKYGLEALNIIQSNKEYFNQSFAEKEPWMVKNIIVSYFGLGQIDDAKNIKTFYINLIKMNLYQKVLIVILISIFSSLMIKCLGLRMVS